MRSFISLFRTSSSRRPTGTRPTVEALELRLTPYTVSGNAWPHPELVTLSFVPDGTVLTGNPITSNLFQKFNAKFGSATTWQNVMLKAAQQWAANANLNFAVKTDNGAAAGSGSYQQGDPNFGDIRVGGFNYGSDTLGSAYMPPPVNNYSIAGDANFNTNQTFNIGTTYDLFTVTMHEIGHSLGLYHATGSAAIMYSPYQGVKTQLNADDIAGIQAIYGVRPQDAYDAAAANGSFATASDLTPLVSTSTLTALAQNLDVTATTDKDYYRVTVPAGTNGTMVVRLQSSGLSLLAPKLTVYAADQTTNKGSANGFNQFGTTLTVTVTGVVAGETYYLKAEGADATVMGTGKYALALTFGTNPTPTVPLPNTQTANGSPLSNGGGQGQTPWSNDIHDLPGLEIVTPAGHDRDHGQQGIPASADPETVVSRTQVVPGMGGTHPADAGFIRALTSVVTFVAPPISSPDATTSAPSLALAGPSGAAGADASAPSASDLLFGAEDETLDAEAVDALFEEAFEIA